MKTVPVSLPDWVWGRAATIAEHRGVKVADLIAEGLMGVLNADQHRLAELEAELRKMRSVDPRTRSTRGMVA